MPPCQIWVCKTSCESPRPSHQSVNPTEHSGVGSSQPLVAESLGIARNRWHYIQVQSRLPDAADGKLSCQRRDWTDPRCSERDCLSCSKLCCNRKMLTRSRITHLVPRRIRQWPD